MPNYSDLLSSIAIVVSLGSLSVSAYVAFRDRPRLKVTGQYLAGPSRILLTFINMGRRPVLLRLLGGTSEIGKWSAAFLEQEKGGLRLGEHERYEHTIVREDTVTFDLPNGGSLVECLWVEDSLGNRYQVPNSRELITELWS